MRFASAPRRRITGERQAIAFLQASRLQAGFPRFLKFESENRATRLQTDFSSWHFATLSPTRFQLVAFRHSSASPISARGVLPLLRQADFSSWCFAIASPSRFLSVAFRHSLASSISACGISPFVRWLDFGVWRFAARPLA